MILTRVSSRAWGWIGPLGVALLAFVLRVWNVGRPRFLMFDETYYAKDAWSLLQHGYVQEFVDDANDRILAGDTTGIFDPVPGWIVHPEAGKWFIALGEQVFGLDAFGWRISAVVAGSLMVLVLARLVRRITGSTWIGCFAGLLLCFDGMHFVMSRIALLDIFLALWILCGVACLVADRDWIRARLDRHRALRPWQLLAGICFGLAVGTKWSGVYALAVFGVLAVVWEVLARRRAALEDPAAPRFGWVRTTLRAGIPAFGSIVLVALLVYLVTWSGYIDNHRVYEALFGLGWGEYSGPWGTYTHQPSQSLVGGWWDALRSLWHFHAMTYEFHRTGLTEATHPYQSDPAGWLVMERPVGVDARSDLPAATCGAPADSSCLRVVTILGNPVLWWTGAVALLSSVVAWVSTRDWRWGVPVLGVAATWLPWFLYQNRPIFSFYAITVVPFTVLAVAVVLKGLSGAARTPRQRYVAWVGAGAYLTAVVVAFWYFHPLYTGELVTYDEWYSRMWFDRWI